MTRTLIVLVAAVFFAIVPQLATHAQQPKPPSHAPAPKAKKALTPVETLIALTSVGKDRFIESYTIGEGNAVRLQLTPRHWNELSNGQQRQLCDVMAATCQKLGLNNVTLWVVSTEIGHIGLRWTGSYGFDPSLASLK